MSDAITRLRALAAKLAESPGYADQQSKIRCPGDDDQSARGRLAFESGILGHRCTSAADEISLIIRLLTSDTEPETRKDLCAYCGKPTRKGSAVLDEGQTAHRSCIREFEGQS